MTIEELPIGKIKPATYNPRKDLKPNDPAYERLKKALNSFDLVEPLVWNRRTGNLVGGHQRFKILQERGDTTVPVSVVDLDEREEKILNIALNKHSGEWEYASLANLIEELDVGEFDMELTGFTAEEFEKIATWSAPPSEFKTVDETIEIEHICPKCGYKFSGGQTARKKIEE